LWRAIRAFPSEAGGADAPLDHAPFAIDGTKKFSEMCNVFGREPGTLPWQPKVSARVVIF
jgi:hypothetical protein